MCTYLDGDDIHTGCEVAVPSYSVLVLSNHHNIDQTCQVVVVPHCSRVNTPKQDDRFEVVLNINCLITVMDHIPDVLPPLRSIFAVADVNVVKLLSVFRLRNEHLFHLGVESAAETRQAQVNVVSTHLVCHFSRLSPFSRGQYEYS